MPASIYEQCTKGYSKMAGNGQTIIDLDRKRMDAM
jgi:hypothetical protein